MGLCLGWHLELPLTTPREEIRARLESLRALAQTLPLAWVEPELSELKGEALAELQRDGYVWGGTAMFVKDDPDGVPRMIPHDEEGCDTRFIDPTELKCFVVQPGAGCETAHFGVGLFPEAIRVQSETTNRWGVVPVPESRSWHGPCICKTQYASHPGSGGTEHFVRCHLALTAILDRAMELGFTVEVADDGGYWETRDVAALVKELDGWNHLVAGFAGTFNDIAKKAGSAQGTSPVLERPDFEHLEAARPNSLPRAWSDPWVPKLLELTSKLRPASTWRPGQRRSVAGE